MSRLILGTVQFGLDYGIKNSRGKVPGDEVAKILDAAKAGGIDTLDTAAAYGESEAVLGKNLGSATSLKVVSKLRTGFEGTCEGELRASLCRLRLPRLHGYLLHNFDIYRVRPTVLKELSACVAEGLVERIGASLYNPAEAIELLESGEPLDIVQVPYSLLDRRFEPVFPALKERGIEIHVRSVFLQGALLMEPDTLPRVFNPVRDRLAMLKRLSKKYNVPISTLCLGFAAANPNVDGVVMGVDGISDLAANIEAFSKRDIAAASLAAFPDISTDDEDIILPYRWKKE